MENAEKLAEELYIAVTDLLADSQTVGLLAAVGDAKSGLPFDKASPKTRIVFMALAVNLTRARSR